MIQCREIQADDFENVVALLNEGFGPRNYRVDALQRLADHRTPPGLPKYGYVLKQDQTLVGVVLLIFTEIHIGGRSHIRCNVSSWYVRPAFRAYASLLAMQASRHRNVIFFNVTPAPHTWPTLEALGFTRFAAGYMVAVPLLGPAAVRAHVGKLPPVIHPDRDLDQAEIDLLQQHQQYGCLSLICEADGQRFPFVFKLTRRHGGIRLALLVYCRDSETFVRFARPIGWFLLRRGCLLVKLDSNGPVPGLVGRYVDGRPKYRKGGDQVHLGDVAYSEEAMFQYLG
ncbi:CBS domain-containing protein [Rhodopila globiformis]|uniref:N-acetyltransferase domain-containing protein n=1 Tax=Rhodopila globiformis TaxID=1071 RepID=A0A2S6NGH0_RHOGL|nr:acyl-CoA acyltransferase [Rhodopila globiformis]PPQ33690.1 hypothetical protein CCS01_13530 [Rhodopila globiformis]